MELKRQLNLWDVFCIATGAMISSGLFVLPALAYKYGGPAIVLSYFLAGFLIIPSILSKSELSSAMPKSGGTYFFIERSFGPFLGIFSGFASWFSVGLKSAFALVGIGVFLEFFVPNVSYLQIKLLAAGCCVFFILVNLFSVKATTRLQNFLVLFLLLVCGVYIVICIPKMDFSHFLPFVNKGIKPIFSVAGIVFISYGGLTKVASIAEDIKNPSKTIPLGMFLSFFVVQVLYVCCVAVTIGLLSPVELTATLTPLTHAGVKAGNTFLGILVSLAALSAFVTTANAGILSSSRVPLAMAKDDLLPFKFSLVSRKFNTPYVSILVTGIFMVVLILSLNLENLVKTASTLMLILFIFENLAVIIMRESKIINYRPTFISPLYPWVQIFAIVAYFFLIFEMGKVPLLISAGFVLGSFLWYFFSARKLGRQSALLHIVERITDKQLVNNTLEEELKDILHKRDNIIKDRFDHLIEKCLIFDLDRGMPRNEFFSLIANAISLRVGMNEEIIKQLLAEREEQTTTVIEKGLAIPHIVIEGEAKFDIVIVRSKEGVIFSKQQDAVHVIFVLVGSKDERNFHLRVLMSIANIVREHNFYQQFMQARSEEQLRLLILSSTRKRI